MQMENAAVKKKRRVKIRKWWRNRRFLRNHVIICGLGRKGMQLAEGFAGEGHRVVIIEIDKDNNLISQCRKKGMMVLIGDAANEELLKKAGIKKARYLISVCGEDKTNTEVAEKCRNLAENSHNRNLTCSIHIENPRLYRLPWEQELGMLPDQPAALLKENKLQINVFDGVNVLGLLDGTCTPAVIKNEGCEILAQTIHEEYVHKQRHQGQTPQTNPSMVSWHLLPETLKESNRNQAVHICVKLKNLGCGIAPLTTWNPPDFKFTPDEIEQMARLEHERWVEERRTAGWKYAAGPKDIREKTSPYIVPWEELSEKIKDLDRDTVRNLPLLLAKAGFQIYRLKEKQKEDKEESR